MGHSLALLSDAAHMLADAAALGLSLLALQLASRPARGAMTFGYSRAEVLSAQANGITLLILGAFIAYEGDLEADHSAPRERVPDAHDRARRASSPTSWRRGCWRRRAAQPQHRGQPPARPHGPVCVPRRPRSRRGPDPDRGPRAGRSDRLAGDRRDHDPRRRVAGRGASARVSSRPPPRGLDPEAMGAALASQSGVVEVHDLHVWEITSGFPALSAHVLVGAKTGTATAPAPAGGAAARAFRPRSHDPSGGSPRRTAAGDRPGAQRGIAPPRAPEGPPARADGTGRCSLWTPSVYVHSRSPCPPGSAPVATPADGTPATDRSVRPLRGFALEPCGNRFCR